MAALIMQDKFFTIPVYICSPEEYEKKREAYFNSQMKRYNVDQSKESQKLFEETFHKYLWRPWEYNQIIGYIELDIFGKDIRGEYSFTSSKRFSVYKKKRCYWLCGKAFEMGVYHEQESEVIYKNLLSKLENLKDESPCKGRYIDLREFCKIGPFIDWKRLLGY